MRILAFFNLTKKLLFCIIIEIFIFLVKQIFKEAFMEKVDTKQEFLELFQQNLYDSLENHLYFQILQKVEKSYQ